MIRVWGELFQQPGLICCHTAARIDQVRALSNCAVQPLGSSISLDASVIAAAQNIGDHPPPEVSGPCVLRLFKQP